MPSFPIPTYAFDFGLGIPYGRGLPSGYGYVARTSEEPGEVLAGVFAYRLDDLPVARTLGRTLPPHAADAIDVATAVYVADRLGPRHDRGITRPPGERWPRRLRLRVPVREAGRWSAPAVREGLERLLHFWTDDDWRLSFVPRSSRLAPRPAELQRPLLVRRIDGGAAVVLHSGGLDGTIGLIEAARGANGRLVVPASVTTNARARDVQDRILAGVSGSIRLGRPDLAGARAYANLSGVKRSQQESTQRARALLYLTVGAVAAQLGGDRQLAVAEHGVGAINLPYAADQIGARTTKAVHPRALALFGDLFSTAADQPILVDNPLLWLTKGEACGRLSPDLVPVARETVSCDRFPRRDASRACGLCTNCLARRAALVAARRGEVDGPGHRAFDFDPTEPEGPWSDVDLVPLAAMRGQAEELGLALAAADPWPALAAAFPELHDVVVLHTRWGLTAAEVAARLVRLYAAYVEEMEGLFAAVARRGWGLGVSADRPDRHPLSEAG